MLKLTVISIALVFALTFCASSEVFGQVKEKVEPLRLAVVGLTHGHVNWILKRAVDDDIEIVGIYEPNQEVALKYAQKYNFGMSMIYSDLDLMLTKLRPEAITAFNPIDEHIDVVRAAAPLGIHVMVEKPLSTSYEEALEMQRLATENNIHLITNFETSWYPSTAKVFSMAHDENKIGSIRKIVVHDGHPGPQEIGVQAEFLEWLTDPSKNGAGALTDFGCYGANLATWILKGQRPSSVTALTQTIKPEIYPKVDDEATILLTYPTTQVIIQASWNWPHNRKDWEVYGTKAFVRTVDDKQMFYKKDGVDEMEIEAPEMEPIKKGPFTYLRSLVKGEIESRADDLGSLEINIIVAEILDAAIRSAKENRTIFLEG